MKFIWENLSKSGSVKRLNTNGISQKLKIQNKDSQEFRSYLADSLCTLGIIILCTCYYNTQRNIFLYLTYLAYFIHLGISFNSPTFHYLSNLTKFSEVFSEISRFKSKPP
jgi:hypothetical protein